MLQLRGNTNINCFALSIGFLIFTCLISHSNGQSYLKTSNSKNDGKALEVYISEISNCGNADLNFVELYNPNNFNINLSSENYYLSRDNVSSVSDVALTGTISANGTYVCAVPYSWFFITWKWFYWEYGVDPNQQNNSWSFENSTSFMLYKGGNSNSGTLIDIYGALGEESEQKDWDYTNAHAVRKRNINSPNSHFSKEEWVIISGGSNQYSPGQHAADLEFSGSSGSWNTRANWSGLGYVPDASCNIEINEEQSILVESSSACYDLLIENNAQLSVEAGQDIEVVGELSNQQGFDGLVLNSNSGGCASLMHSTSDVEARMHSYFPDLGKWYFVSSPIENATAQIFYGEYLTYWNEPSSNWMFVTNENEILQPGNAYSLKKSESNNCIYEGELNTGTVLIDSLRYTETTVSDLRGWNLVGNPYPSVLDFNQVDLEGKNINAGISVWPHNGTEESSYISWSQGGGSPVGNDEARYIQPGQGFMIQVYEDLEFFELDNSCRTNANTGVFDKSQATAETNANRTLVIELWGENTTRDKTYFALREEATLFFDKESDVKKLFGEAHKPHVFSYAGFEQNIPLSINCIDSYHENNEYYLGVRPGSSGVYTLIVSGLQTFQEQNIWILDELENTLYSLETDSLITFYYEVGQPEKRFKIIFDEEVAINNLDLKTSEIGVYIRSNSLYLSGYNCEEGLAHVQVFDLLGRLLMEHPVYVGFDGLQLHLSSAYYIVGVEYKNTTTYHKIFISSNYENI